MSFLLNWVPSRGHTWLIIEYLETTLVKIILQEHGYQITPSVLLEPALKTLNSARDPGAGLGEVCVGFLVLSHIERMYRLGQSGPGIARMLLYLFNMLPTATGKTAHVSPR